MHTQFGECSARETFLKIWVECCASREFCSNQLLTQCQKTKITLPRISRLFSHGNARFFSPHGRPGRGPSDVHRNPDFHFRFCLYIDIPPDLWGLALKPSFSTPITLSVIIYLLIAASVSRLKTRTVTGVLRKMPASVLLIETSLHVLNLRIQV